MFCYAVIVSGSDRGVDNDVFAVRDLKTHWTHLMKEITSRNTNLFYIVGIDHSEVYRELSHLDWFLFIFGLRRLVELLR